MFVISRTALGFDPAELRLLEGISDLAGLAISNAERFQRLASAADTDLVTGLHNRARFERELAAQNGTKLAILSIDLDQLKLINDTYGHEAGDAVLGHVAEALDKLVGGRGPLARTGADEFAVLLPGASTLEAVALAEELRTAMYGLVPPYGTARISVGVAGSMVGGDARSTWSAADAALVLAKQWGRDRVECARTDTPPATHTPTRWDELASQLVDARDIDSVYQPVVRLHDHSIVGYEALARPFGAKHDLSVEELFAAAHRIGLSRELDWLSRRAAVRGARALPAETPLFINCSIDALLNPVHGVDQMLLVLDWAERAPQDVVLEINEREVVHDLDRLREVLATYRGHGFRFAIDDVGEGRSTLEVMATAEPEFVKIARSLTVSAQQLGHRSAIHAVVAFARTSGAIVIAEGIEGEREEELMAAMDVDHGQGWWLGRPVKVAAKVES
jgi:diguanylate cyclase (GGDEF)-like protein